MTVTISGTSGVSLCDTNSVPTAALQASAVTQAKVGSGVAGSGPAFSAAFVGTQSVTSNVLTKVTLNTEQFDTANAFDATTNYRFTPTVAGYYQFSYAVSGTANAGTLQVTNACFYKNGSELIAGYSTGSFAYPTAVAGQVSSGSILTYLNGTTDYIELYGKVIGTSPYFNSAYLTGCLVRSA